MIHSAWRHSSRFALSQLPTQQMTTRPPVLCPHQAILSLPHTSRQKTYVVGQTTAAVSWLPPMISLPVLLLWWFIFVLFPCHVCCSCLHIALQHLEGIAPLLCRAAFLASGVIVFRSTATATIPLRRSVVCCCCHHRASSLKRHRRDKLA